mmetsp:Transcript_6841/g.7856  ORF Transcript_6841/g.7856 Transcript_6841/m.7856 type:complete len:214 (+) Transcript_6841:155-796(+)|eukprot:CAMPEP_0184072492 /NCGR_PEP_ID=MMETSP0957-20130417/59393_1 /TAXON_ID=627963 /ORGANISM="Aplanochytrium sp, Strain PBS07" /LENGTH=213 /DNA_ID=CAMNT_0026373573 /DNA_START=147 /DNA_END=788 /DNA_ORIENTATION=-
MASLDHVVQIPSDVMQQLPEDVQNLIAEASNTSQNNGGLPIGTHVATFKEKFQAKLCSSSSHFESSTGRFQQVGLTSGVAMDTLNKVNQEWYRLVYSDTPYVKNCCVNFISTVSFLGCIGFSFGAFFTLGSEGAEVFRYALFGCFAMFFLSSIVAAASNNSLRLKRESAVKEINATVLAQEVQGTIWTIDRTQETSVDGRRRKQGFVIEVVAA